MAMNENKIFFYKFKQNSYERERNAFCNRLKSFLKKSFSLKLKYVLPTKNGKSKLTYDICHSKISVFTSSFAT